MAGHTPWREIRRKMSPQRRARLEKLKKRFEKQLARARARARQRKRPRAK